MFRVFLLLRIARVSLPVFGLACSPAPLPSPPVEPPAVVLPAAVRELPPDAVAALLQRQPDTVIIDVRTETEMAEQGRLPGAAQFDYFHGEAMLERLGRLDRAKPCLVYCAIGGRSKLMAVKMHEMGFSDLTVLKGGLNGWIASGKPVVKS